MEGRLWAGTAKVDITPPLTIPYLGYVPRQARFEGVHDPLHARALVLDDGRQQVALVTADSIGYSHAILGPGRHFREEVCRQVERRTGISPERVMVAASHAHSTPETLNITDLLEVPQALGWLEDLTGRLAGAAAAAQQALQPARIKAGRGRAEGIAANRRQLLRDGRFYQPAHGAPPSPVVRPGRVDEEVGVVLVEFEDGTCSVLANFACHPVTVQVQPLVSADYPGVACSLVEQTVPGCRHCLFTQGADGDLNPRRGDTRDFGDVSRYGQILGGEIMKVVAGLGFVEVEAGEPVLGAAIAEVLLPGRDLPSPEPFRQAAARERAAAEKAEDSGARFAALNQARGAEEALRTIAMGAGPVQTLVQVLRLGGVALVGCPGELFVELGLEIKQQAVAPFPFVVGYANDYVGYLSTPAAFEEGGYETSLGPWCLVGPEGGRRVVDAGLSLVRRLWMERG